MLIKNSGFSLAEMAIVLMIVGLLLVGLRPTISSQIVTGGALTGQTHPSGNLTDYLEGENLTPADLIYENKNRASNFNDQVIVVAP